MFCWQPIVAIGANGETAADDDVPDDGDDVPDGDGDSQMSV